MRPLKEDSLLAHIRDLCREHLASPAKENRFGLKKARSQCIFPKAFCVELPKQPRCHQMWLARQRLIPPKTRLMKGTIYSEFLILTLLKLSLRFACQKQSRQLDKEMWGFFVLIFLVINQLAGERMGLLICIR